MVLLSRPPAAAAAEEPAKAPVSFIKDVAPIFQDHCFSCHDAKKRKGKLDMTTFESLRKGGDNDDPITPGKPDDSFLIQLVTPGAPKRMPPKDNGDPLPKEKIEIIARWIQEGAKLDAGIDPKADLWRELRVRWKPPAPVAAYKYPVIITALAFTPDNQKIVVSGRHELTVWNVADGKLEKRIATRSERAYAMAFLPDGKLAVAGGRPGRAGDVRIYDINAGMAKVENGVTYLDGVNDPAVMLKELLETDDAVLCLAASADGKRLAAGGCDRQVRVWDLSGGVAAAKLEQAFENHADWVMGVCLAPDGKHLLTASRDKTAKVWDLTAKESVLTFPEHQNTVYDVTIKADNSVGFSVGEDNQLRTWAATGEGKQVRASGGHGKAVLKVARHPKEPLLVTASADNTVRIWNLDNGANVKTLTGHTDQVFAVAISPDGALIASGSFNGEVKLWKVDGTLVKGFNASPGLPEPMAPAPAKQ
jgi:WD40 repeat protein